MKPAAHAAADLAVLAAGRAGLLAASALSMRTATRLLGPREMGTMNLALAAVGLAALLVAGCSHFFYRQAMAWLLEGTLGANLRRYAALLVAAGLAAAALAACLPAAWLPLPNAWMALLLAGNLVVATLQQALLHLVNLAGRRAAYALLGNAAAWGGLALAAAAAGAFGASAAHWLAGLLAAQGVVLLLAGGVLARHAVPARAAAKAEAFTARAVFAFAGPLVVCMALYWVQRSLALPWLAATQGTAAVGLFSVAFSVGMLAMLSFDTLFKELYAPRYEREVAQADRAAQAQAWERYAAAFFPAALAACVCTAAAGAALLQALTGPAFHGLGRFVAWGAACQLGLSVYSLVMLQAARALDNRGLVLPHAAGALLTALLLQASLPVDAMTQAALATAAGLLATTALAAWRLRHAARWPWRRTALAGAFASPALGLVDVAQPLLVLAGVALFGALLQWRLARGWWPARAAA